MPVSSQRRFHAATLRRCLAAIGAAFALVVVPSALATSVTPANGKDFILPDNDVYQLGANGMYHLIPDVPTANAMGIDWNTLQQVSGLGPIGAPFTSIVPPTPVKIVAPTTMANGNEYLLPDGTVFHRDSNGVYHWIPDVATANAMGVKWNMLHRAASVSPVGSPIRSVVVREQPACSKRLIPSTKANGNDFIAAPNQNVYQRDARGVYHLIPDIATANAMGLKWNKLKKVTSIAPIGEPIASICLG